MSQGDPRVEEYKRDLTAELRRQPEQMQALAQGYIADNVARPLADAVERSFRDVAQTDLDQLFRTLHALDQDLHALRELRNDPDAAPGHYELWARYWTSISPDMEIVKGLVADVVLPRLPELREDVAAFRLPDPGLLSFREFDAYWQDKAAEPRLGPVEEGPQSWGRWLLTLGARRRTLRSSCPAAGAIGQLQLRTGPTADQSFEKAITEQFRQWLESIPLIQKMDVEASRQVPNATFSGFGPLFCRDVSRTFATALETEKIQLLDRVLRAETKVLALGPLALAPLPPPGVTVLAGLASSLAALISAGLFWTPLGGGIMALLGGLSLYQVRRQLRLAARRELVRLAEVLVERAAARTAALVNVDLINRLIERIAVQLNPRPLQRALNGSLE
jgi:hypothetical protein